LRLTVNLSARQLLQPNLLAMLRETLAETGLPTYALELEIAEDIPTGQFDPAALDELRAMGLKISIDDFGIGSSLATLSAWPLNTLKIDCSFVQGMLTNDSDRAIVAATISVAHQLNLEVVAEGVETEEQLAFLRAQQCDEMQGYLFSSPLPAEELTRLLQDEDRRRLPLPDLNERLDLAIRAQAGRHIGYALVNEDLIILMSNPRFNRWGKEHPTDLRGQFLPEVWPELVGVEDDLRQLLHTQEEVFSLPQVYRLTGAWRQEEDGPPTPIRCRRVHPAPRGATARAGPRGCLLDARKHRAPHRPEPRPR
jgi:PAS domain-containing protein